MNITEVRTKEMEYLKPKQSMMVAVEDKVA